MIDHATITILDSAAYLFPQNLFVRKKVFMCYIFCLGLKSMCELGFSQYTHKKKERKSTSK